MTRRALLAERPVTTCGALTGHLIDGLPHAQLVVASGPLTGATLPRPEYTGRHREYDGTSGVTGSTPGIRAARDRRSAESERRYAASLLAEYAQPEDTDALPGVSS